MRVEVIAHFGGSDRWRLFPSSFCRGCDKLAGEAAHGTIKSKYFKSVVTFNAKPMQCHPPADPHAHGTVNFGFAGLPASSDPYAPTMPPGLCARRIFSIGQIRDHGVFEAMDVSAPTESRKSLRRRMG